ncbi:pregnancy-specific glycoprotein 22 isoform X1 [Cricetulus griseus]|uniref:pregnancy-specific glycoprotein 22 isoform X1 n=1 Tax=Cricetulus griseus TaxID=10029 RepID=UPI000F737B49|nr:pregnancy-specific glycoprotein 22 isoform X1 [Cricetulus griseus]
MEMSSVCLYNGCTPWQGLLLTASLLTCWHLSATAHVTIESVPPQVVEGENVLFLVHNLPDDVLNLAWAKGVNTMHLGIGTYLQSENLSVPGTESTGRESVYSNGSLLLRNVTKKDTGFYTLRVFNSRVSIVSTTTIYLHVHTVFWTCGSHASSSKPTIESVPPCVAEGGSALLRVRNPPENIVSFVWFKWMTALKELEVARYIIDRKSTLWGPAYSGRETLYSDGSLLLHGVTQKDVGWYTLQIVRTDTKREEAKVQLHVDTSLSLYCNLLSSSKFMIQPVPLYAAEGESVLLQVHNLPEDLQGFSWYKSKYRKPILNTDLTEEDAGIYTFAVLNKDSTIEKAYVKFYVKKPVAQPFVQITDTTIAGHRSAIFTCISPDTDVSIRWIFNNQSLNHLERMTLSPTKCGLMIAPVRREDAGEYQYNLIISLSDKYLYPGSNLNVFCSVASHPPAQYSCLINGEL